MSLLESTGIAAWSDGLVHWFMFRQSKASRDGFLRFISHSGNKVFLSPACNIAPILVCDISRPSVCYGEVSCIMCLARGE